MKRYRLRYSQQTRTAQRSDAEMVEHPQGEWVRYSELTEEAEKQEEPEDERV